VHWRTRCSAIRAHTTDLQAPQRAFAIDGAAVQKSSLLLNKPMRNNRSRAAVPRLHEVAAEDVQPYASECVALAVQSLELACSKPVAEQADEPSSKIPVVCVPTVQVRDREASATQARPASRCARHRCRPKILDCRRHASAGACACSPLGCAARAVSGFPTWRERTARKRTLQALSGDHACVLLGLLLQLRPSAVSRGLVTPARRCGHVSSVAAQGALTPRLHRKLTISLARALTIARKSSRLC
jgi:hypothetical protein